MRASEILRKLADVIDAAETGNDEQQPHAPENVNTVTLKPAQANNADQADKVTMVPPLQQKMEILKKSVGVDNEFDHGFDQIDAAHDDSDVELAMIKKSAGLTAPQQEAADDEPLDI